MSAASVKQRNLDCAILFMQQDHANTLKGLHLEIEKLQKRCSDLNLQLAMHNTSISQEDVYRERVQSLEVELQEERKNKTILSDQIDLKEKKFQQVELQIRALERHHQEEMKVERQKNLSLHRELEGKATMVATLTTQLHSFKREMKLKMASRPKRTIKSASSISSEDDLNLSTDLSPRFTNPTPPKDAPPRMRRRSTNRTLSMENVECLAPVQVRPGTSNHRDKFLQMQRAENMDKSVLDPTPFLKSVSLESREAVRKSGKTVLPPISNTYVDPLVNTPSPRRTSSDQFMQKLLQRPEVSGSAEVEVESLAVDQVSTQKHSLRRAHEYQSSD